jgi:Skp family chaperone for outer membrane proteins
MFAAAVVSLALGLSSAFAQTKDNPASIGTTRVAVINLGLVFNKYDRAAALKKELDNKLVPLKEEAKTLTQNLTAWQVSIQKLDLGDPKRKSLEEKMIQARRQMEDMQRTAQFRIGKLNEDNLITIWKDIHQAVKDYSAKHNIELVMAYGDPVEKELAVTFPHISRKMQTADQGGSIPFFVSPRADISQAVADLLNKKYRDNQAKTEDLD